MYSVLHRPGSGVSKASLLVSAAAAVLLAGCSNSVERFAENPSDADPVYTASVPKKASSRTYASSSDDSVTSQPLASSTTSKPLYSYNSKAQQPSYQPPAYQPPAYKAPSVAAAPAPIDGSSVTVGPGMTLYSIAKSNNIPVSRLAAANGLRPPYAVHQGMVLRIPGNASASMPAVASVDDGEAPSSQMPFKKAAAASTNGSHGVTSGETLFSLGRKYGVSPYAIADLNGLPHDAALKVGQSLRIPGAGGAVAQARTAAKPPVETAQADVSEPVEEVTSNADAPAAAAVPAPKKDQTQLATSGEDSAAPQVSPDTGPGVPGMRWPVKGKVISEFGAKPNGLKNEGINIAVPEGTSVRAADDGVVAYSGNELKGYGNLVLIRHSGGWVTAYAHAKELFVKRGDTVKRGDVIAKAGQTGSVSSPQLHFEVRKGAVAMDPLKFLGSNTASN